MSGNILWSDNSKFSTISFEDINEIKDMYGKEKFDQMFGCKKRQLSTSSGPMEISSKKPKRKPQIKQGGIDPRFHSESTQYGGSMIVNAYKFLSDKIKEESSILVAKLKENISEEESLRIKGILTRRKQQEKSEKDKLYERRVNATLRGNQIEMLEKGQHPQFVTRKTKRQLVLNERMKNKSAKSINKYHQKKERKAAIKDYKYYKFLN